MVQKFPTTPNDHDLYCISFTDYHTKDNLQTKGTNLHYGFRIDHFIIQVHYLTLVKRSLLNRLRSGSYLIMFLGTILKMISSCSTISFLFPKKTKQFLSINQNADRYLLLLILKKVHREGGRVKQV